MKTFTLFFFLALIWVQARSQNSSPLPASEIKKLSIEELMNMDVTTVSKAPEKLTEVASAIQVITGEDIRRSTAERLPDALSLAPNLQVARTNAHDYAITARGFNGAPLSTSTLADKLLVMIDGRTIYEPLFGGVFWDAQNVLLEDISRVEVVSGPGGTLWGANAVNGVINIISKSAKETQGLYLSGSYGSFYRDYGAFRYGSHVDSTFFFRIYGQRLEQDNSFLNNGKSALDGWNMTQGGFRMDYLPSTKTTVTLQGDLYNGKEGDSTTTYLNGQNVLGRFSHTFSDRSDISIQAYFDRTWRNLPYASFKTILNTYDIELQHHFSIKKRNRILWGAGYRLMDNNNQNSTLLSFNPQQRTLKLFNGFVQDRFALKPERLDLIVGAKLLHNDYTGFELQPSARLAWTPGLNNTIWAAVSRAVRTPSRLDVDEHTPSIATPGKFLAEDLTAYELGYRVRPAQKVSLSFAGYYNRYIHLRTVDINTSAPPSLMFANDQRAETYGVEISGNVIISAKWRLHGGYNYLHKKFTTTNTLALPGSALFEGLDPRSQATLQSIMELPEHFQLDLVAQYVDRLPVSAITPMVPAYFSLNTRLAWEYRHYSVAVMGEDLGSGTHTEFGAHEIPRGIYTKITMRF